MDRRVRQFVPSTILKLSCDTDEPGPPESRIFATSRASSSLFSFRRMALILPGF